MKKHIWVGTLVCGGATALVALAAENGLQFRPPANVRPVPAMSIARRNDVRPATSAAKAVVTIEHCLITPEADIQVPALEAGPLVEVAVEENAVIQKGQLLARIDDRKPQLEMIAAEKERAAALAKASDDIETRFAKAAFDVEDAELDKLMAATSKQQRSVSDSEVRRVRLSRHKAELQIERSKLEREIAHLQADVHDANVKQAQEAVNRRKIVAPIDGVIVSLFHNQGEWVSAGEPVIQVVKMDTLRAEGFVNVADHDVIELADREVLVEVELAGKRRETFQGRITMVSPLVQAGNKYRVRAEVTNRTEGGHWLLRPGMAASMSLQIQ